MRQGCRRSSWRQRRGHMSGPGTRRRGVRAREKALGGTRRTGQARRRGVPLQCSPVARMEFSSSLIPLRRFPSSVALVQCSARHVTVFRVCSSKGHTSSGGRKRLTRYLSQSIGLWSQGSQATFAVREKEIGDEEDPFCSTSCCRFRIVPA